MVRRKVIDPSASARQALVFGAVLFGLVAIALLAAAIAYAALPSGILGVVFLLIAALFGYGGRRYRGGPRFVLDTEGISCVGDYSWSVEWVTLRMARTNYAAGPGDVGGHTACLELIPVEPAGAADRADLSRWWVEAEELWRFPLPPTGNGMRKLGHAVRRFRSR